MVGAIPSGLFFLELAKQGAGRHPTIQGGPLTRHDPGSDPVQVGFEVDRPYHSRSIFT